MRNATTRPSRTDIVAAAIVAVLAALGLILLPVMQAAEPDEGLIALGPTNPAWWLAVALLAAQAVALLWATRGPVVVVAAVLAAPVILSIWAPQSAFSLTTIAIMVALFLAVAREPLRSLRVLLPIVTVVVAASQALNELRLGAHPTLLTLGASVLQAAVVVGIPLVIGLYVAAQRNARVSRTNELLALQRERDALIEAAIVRERMAMSRELHDIAAHHMSGIALLASAISKQVDADPAAAKKSAEQVRAQSKSALDDLRRVIGLLRDEASLSVESLASLDSLVQGRGALEVLRGTHDLGHGIGPLAQLVAYRMVQEALANAAAHASAAPCVVEVDDRAADSLVLTVTNGPGADAGAGGGFGLVGMRERADLVGATLEHGPTPDKGWRVRMTFMRETE